MGVGEVKEEEGQRVRQTRHHRDHKFIYPLKQLRKHISKAYVVVLMVGSVAPGLTTIL